MKNLAITFAAIVITLSISSLVQAKGSNNSSYQSSYKSYSNTPKEHNVSGYSRKDGTYVAPHVRTNNDGVKNNNWTTQGNTNPHTGKDGTIPRSYYEYKK